MRKNRQSPPLKHNLKTSVQVTEVPPPSSRENWGWAIRWPLSAQAALLAGIGVRLWYYFLNDSFWRDESKLLLNVAQKSFLALTGPLQYEQEAPLPLLWLYRLIYLAGGGGELSVRAVSLACSILGLLLFFYLAKRLLADERAVAFSTWLLSLAPGLILFAAMAKPYALDILVATILLILAAPIFTSEKGDSPSFSRLIWAAALAPWLSYPAIFILGGIGAALLLNYRRVGLSNVIKFISITLLSEAAQVLIVLDRILMPERFAQMERISNSFSVISNWWLWLFCQIFYAYLGPKISSIDLEYPLGYYFDPFLIPVAMLVLLGIWEVKRRHGWAWIMVLFGPLLLASIACSLKLYMPFGRTLLFAVPGIYLLAGYGTTRLIRMLPWPRILSLGLIMLILVCGKYSLDAYGNQVGGIREGLKYIYSQQQPGDLVFVDIYAAPTAAYYYLLGRPYARKLDYGIKMERWIEGETFDYRLRPADVLPLIPREQRVWLLGETMDYVRGPVNEVLAYWVDVEEELDAGRTRISSYTTDRVQVRGFDPGFIR